MKIPSFLQRAHSTITGARQRGPLQPAVLSSGVRLPGGFFSFKADLAKGVPYDIQASTNLRSWSSIYASTSPGEIEFVDADASKSNYKFYRLSMEGKYSVNVIGYITVTVPPGFAMIA